MTKYKKTTDVFSLKTSSVYCGAYTFTIRRKAADINDFGTLGDTNEKCAPD